MILRPLYSMLSPAGVKAKLSTFIFHRVRPEPDRLLPDAVHAVQFDRMLTWLGQWFHVLPLDEAVARLAAGTLPSRAAAITFDDGYADNHEVALPILLRHRMPATFFIATGYLNGGSMWNDSLIEIVRRTELDELDLSGLLEGQPVPMPMHDLTARRATVDRVIMLTKYLDGEQRRYFVERLAKMAKVELPSDSMMCDAQVRQLHLAGMQIGAHTVSHPILAGLPIELVRKELVDSRAALEGLVGARVGLFAYPNGKPGQDFDDVSVSVVRELGFDAAFTTVPGVADGTCDRFQIPRYTPWQTQKLRFGLALAGSLWRGRGGADRRGTDVETEATQ